MPLLSSMAAALYPVTAPAQIGSLESAPVVKSFAGRKCGSSYSACVAYSRQLDLETKVGGKQA